MEFRHQLALVGTMYVLVFVTLAIMAAVITLFYVTTDYFTSPYKDIVPHNDALYTLGSADKQWLYTRSIHATISSTLEVLGLASFTSLTASSNVSAPNAVVSNTVSTSNAVVSNVTRSYALVVGPSFATTSSDNALAHIQSNSSAVSALVKVSQNNGTSAFVSTGSNGAVFTVNAASSSAASSRFDFRVGARANETNPETAGNSAMTIESDATVNMGGNYTYLFRSSTKSPAAPNNNTGAIMYSTEDSVLRVYGDKITASDTGVFTPGWVTISPYFGQVGPTLPTVNSACVSCTGTWTYPYSGNRLPMWASHGMARIYIPAGTFTLNTNTLRFRIYFNLIPYEYTPKMTQFGTAYFNLVNTGAGYTGYWPLPYEVEITPPGQTYAVISIFKKIDMTTLWGVNDGISFAPGTIIEWMYLHN